MSTPALFDGYDVEPAADGQPQSADRRRTARQHQQVAAGIHPLTGEKTRPDFGTCGTCVPRSAAFSAQGYPKCTRGAQLGRRPFRAGPYMTHGAATDCRAWWPACPSHQPASGLPTPSTDP